MKLIIELSKFKYTIDHFVKRYESIEVYNYTTEAELEAYKTKFTTLCNEVAAFLAEQIVPVKNNYTQLYTASKIEFRNTNKTIQSFEIRCKELLNKTKEKKSDIQRIYKLTSVSDAMLNKISKEKIAARKAFTIREKKSLILEKLYQLNDGWYYSIQSICEGNNIHSERRDESKRLSKNLAEDNLIEVFNPASDDILVRLTIQGQEFVEDILLKRLKIKKSVSTIKRELVHEYGDSSLSEIKTNLKELVSKNNFKGVLEKLDLILEDNCEIRNELIMLRGRYASIESKRRNGLLPDSEFLVYENKLRFDIISVIESLKNNEIRK